MRPLYVIRKHQDGLWCLYLNVGMSFLLILGFYRSQPDAIDAIWALDMHRAMAMGPR